jgi:hypothetical protein
LVEHYELSQKIIYELVMVNYTLSDLKNYANKKARIDDNHTPVVSITPKADKTRA